MKDSTFSLYAFVLGGGLDGGINENWTTGSRDGCNALRVVILKTQTQEECMPSV